MINQIDQQLNNVSAAIDWVSTNLKGERRSSSYDDLVKCRRRLKKIKYALQENPATVLYGESQQGKSYLVSSLLSTPDSSFCVIDGETDTQYDFITRINPYGGGAEATSLVTRFSSKPASDIKGYPVRIKLLSLTDMIIVLCDSYYSDLKDHNYIKCDALSNELKEIEETLKDASIQRILEEDDVLDIEEYFLNHFKSKAPYIFDAQLFKRISLIANKLQFGNIAPVFSLLWNKNHFITELFSKLLSQYQKLNYVHEVFAPYSAILNNEGYLLYVQRLHELYSQNNPYNIDIKYYDRGVLKEGTIEASCLCAIASEVVLQIPPDIIPLKEFLNYTDILDFPGARARLERKEEDLQNSELVPEMLLRGKVAYLFNRYSENDMISTLMFCHGPKQSSQRFMPELLKSWIFSFLGESPEKRQRIIDASEGIAPFFVIGTMFNLDMQFNADKDPVGDVASLTLRWKQRFETVLSNEMFGKDNVWLDNWTIGNRSFDNIYLLRDFAYSCEGQSNLFKGWSRNGGIECEEIRNDVYPEFRKDLQKTFLDFPFVKKHFPNPTASWNAVASMNKDGSELIIEKLSKVAEKSNNTRNVKFTSDCQDITADVVAILGKYYHDENSDNELQLAKTKAGNLQAALSLAFGQDPCFFGKLMQRLVLKEGEVYTLFHDSLMQGNQIANNQNVGKYTYIRMIAPGLSKDKSFGENLSILTKVFEQPDSETCKKYFEDVLKVNLQELFDGDGAGMKNPSQTLAETLENHWMYERMGTLAIEQVNQNSVEDMIQMYQDLYRKLNMTDKVSSSIRRYVDRYGANLDDLQEMIADMCAEIINKFVLSVGFDYFTEDAIAALKEANESQSLGLLIDEDTDGVAVEPEDVATSFSMMDNLQDIRNDATGSGIVKYIPGFASRQRWCNRLKIGFVQTKDIPNYDVVANQRLGVIKNECLSVNFE